MPESPADTIRRAAAVVRERAELGAEVVQREREFLLALAESWEHIADDMDSQRAAEEPEGVTDWDFHPRFDWTATLKAARAYIGDETGALLREQSPG